MTCPDEQHHGNPFRYCPVPGCGWREETAAAPDEREVAPGLLELLRKAGDEWGPLGVLHTAAELWPGALAALPSGDSPSDGGHCARHASFDEGCQWCLTARSDLRRAQGYAALSGYSPQAGNADEGER